MPADDIIPHGGQAIESSRFGHKKTKALMSHFKTVLRSMMQRTVVMADHRLAVVRAGEKKMGGK